MGLRVINELAEHKEVRSKCLQRQPEVNQFDSLDPSLVQKVETLVPQKISVLIIIRSLESLQKEKLGPHIFIPTFLSLMTIPLEKFEPERILTKGMVT